MPDRLSLWSPISEGLPELVALFPWVLIVAVVSLLVRVVIHCAQSRRDLRLSCAILEHLDPVEADRIIKEISKC